MKPTVSATAARLTFDLSSAGASLLSNSDVAAALRLCTSSPICSA